MGEPIRVLGLGAGLPAEPSRLRGEIAERMWSLCDSTTTLRFLLAEAEGTL